jgi:hypothetical protein
MQLVEIGRIAINETDQAKIRGAVDIKVPFYGVSRGYRRISACPSSIDRGSGFSGPTLYDSSQARDLGCGDKLRPVSWIELWPVKLQPSPARLSVGGPVIEVHEILEIIEPASVTPV